MDLFTPRAEHEKLHPYFRELVSPRHPEKVELLHAWAEGFPDRDGKFVLEFQTTFNSSFWELYLHAAFRNLGVTVDYTHPAPDFDCSHPVGPFIAEAVIASSGAGYQLESRADPYADWTPEREHALLEYSSVRIANALGSKLEKYRTSYSKLPHVQGKPFVICVAPFEHPQSRGLADRAIRRVIYAYDGPLFEDDPEEDARYVLGEVEVPAVWKPNGASIPFGLFRDGRAAEVSAVVFSNTATFGKLTALTRGGVARTFVFAVRYNDYARQPTILQQDVKEYNETLLDGLHVFRNPFATHPLPLGIFEAADVAIHHGYYEGTGLVSNVPHGFLYSRGTIAMHNYDRGERVEREPPDPNAAEPAVEPWPDSDLRPVGGYSGPFDEAHLAHYRGWTLLVAHDRVDGDWGAMALRGTYRTTAAWTDANKAGAQLLLLDRFRPTREDVASAMKLEIDGQT